MRLLIVGALEGQLSQATKLAMEGGARVAHAPSVEIALATLRAGRGADLLLVSRFGALMAILVATALIGDLILLPALLAGPLGRILIRQRNHARRLAAATGAAASQSSVIAPSTVPSPHAWTGRRLAAAGHRAYTEG